MAKRWGGGSRGGAVVAPHSLVAYSPTHWAAQTGRTTTALKLAGGRDDGAR